MIEKININGVEYHVTPVAEGELPTGVTVKVDGVIYQLGDPVVTTAAEPAAANTEGTIEKISVNGVVYDIADVEAVAAERKRAMEAEAAIGNALSEELGREIDARMSVDNDTRGKGVLFGGFSNRQTTADEVVIRYKNIAQDAEGAFSIPAATTEKAGVMSAEDKKSLDTATSRALRALFVAAGAEYNDTNTNKTKTTPWGETVQHLPKHYYLNGLGDITEEQMTEIYNAGRVMQGVVGHYNRNDKIRTNLPSLYSTSSGYSRDIDGRGMFFGCAELEVAIISKNFARYDKITINSTGAQFVFYNCPKVRYISRLSLESGTSTTNIFGLCSSLSHVEIKSLSTNLSFSNSPLIDKESILYLIQNNKAKSAITITLHADAYARLVNDADIVAALEAQPLVTLVSA